MLDMCMKCHALSRRMNLKPMTVWGTSVKQSENEKNEWKWNWKIVSFVFYSQDSLKSLSIQMNSEQIN